MKRSDFDFAVICVLIILLGTELVTGMYAVAVVAAVVCYTFFKFLDVFLDRK
jgi:hypothetical protein